MPPMEWRAGATWTLPWLGGLCLISYLGDYPEQAKDAGNTGTIGFGWGFLRRARAVSASCTRSR